MHVNFVKCISATKTACKLFNTGISFSIVACRAETIIRTNRLVGYQSSSRRQYYEIG